MGLIKYDGGLLRRGDALANSLNCCCGEGDPCNCNQELTLWIKLAVSGLPSNYKYYEEFCGIGNPCRLRSDAHNLGDMNGTYFVPLVRNCDVSPPTFAFPHSPYEVASVSQTNYDCSGNPSASSYRLVATWTPPNWTLTLGDEGVINVTAFRQMAFPTDCESLLSLSGGIGISRIVGRDESCSPLSPPIETVGELTYEVVAAPPP